MPARPRGYKRGRIPVRDPYLVRRLDELDARPDPGLVLGVDLSLTRDADLVAARDDLFGTFALEANCPECRVDGDYYRGILAGETGRLHEALRWLKRAFFLSRITGGNMRIALIDKFTRGPSGWS